MAIGHSVFSSCVHLQGLGTRSTPYINLVHLHSVHKGRIWLWTCQKGWRPWLRWSGLPGPSPAPLEEAHSPDGLASHCYIMKERVVVAMYPHFHHLQQYQLCVTVDVQQTVCNESNTVWATPVHLCGQWIAKGHQHFWHSELNGFPAQPKYSSIHSHVVTCVCVCVCVCVCIGYQKHLAETWKQGSCGQRITKPTHSTWIQLTLVSRLRGIGYYGEQACVVASTLQTILPIELDHSPFSHHAGSCGQSSAHNVLHGLAWQTSVATVYTQITSLAWQSTSFQSRQQLWRALGWEGWLEGCLG